MIQVFNNPFLSDFLYVTSRLPEDERKQLEAFSGYPYTIDGAAVGGFTAQGPKWVVKEAADQEAFNVGLSIPIMIGGFTPERPGVWRDFLISTPQAWDEKHFFAMTRICRRIMDAMLRSGEAHRLECVVPAPRLESRPELERWYTLLGYNKEGLRYGYCANGADAVAFARVKH